jgi:dUTP pyrophosphatase
MWIRWFIVSEHNFGIARATPEAAGFDIKAAESVVLYPGRKKLIKTGIHAAFAPGHVCFMKEKSGLALKHGLEVKAGVIDSDYRGEWCVLVWYNPGKDSLNQDQPLTIHAGDRLTQGVFLKVPLTVDSKVITKEQWDAQLESEKNKNLRGTGGFGSTGK